MSHILGWAAVAALLAVAAGLIAALVAPQAPAAQDTQEDAVTVPEPAVAALEASEKWWLDPHEHKTWPACYEPVTPAEVEGIPPWDAAAASQGTGYTKWHAEHLRDLLGRRPS